MAEKRTKIVYPPALVETDAAGNLTVTHPSGGATLALGTKYGGSGNPYRGVYGTLKGLCLEVGDPGKPIDW